MGVGAGVDDGTGVALTALPQLAITAKANLLFLMKTNELKKLF